MNSQNETVGPEWHRIAPAASIQSQEIAKLLITAVFAMAVQKARQGSIITFSLKVGKLTISQG